MPVGGNFNPTVIKRGSVLTVSGPSDGLPDAMLVARHVALQQPVNADVDTNTQYVVGSDAALAPGEWQVELLLEEMLNIKPAHPAPVIVAGKPVLAVGSETYFSGHPDNPAAPAAFVTITWSEVLEVKELD